MLVLRDVEHFKVYYPKLDIKACLTLDNLYGSITKPLQEAHKTETLLFVLSLCLSEYNIDDDKLYSLADTIDDLYGFIVELYKESGLIEDEEEQDKQPQDKETKEQVEHMENLTFTQQIDELLEQCMSIGMNEKDFYASTFKQVTRYAKAHNEKEKRELEELAFFNWQLGNLVGISVARMMSKGVKYPELKEAFPFIDVKPSNDKKVDNDELTSEEKMVSAQIYEWAIAMQKKQESKKQEVNKTEGSE